MGYRKYESVARYGKRGTTELIGSGKPLIVQEKLDGANASMLCGGDVVRCFSRNQELDEHNTLRGFYSYAQQFEGKLKEGFTYYGEWLVQHKIKYHASHMQEFYLYGVYDWKNERFIAQKDVLNFAEDAGMNYLEAFMIGIIADVDEFASYIGESNYGLKGEGVVVKYWDNPEDYGMFKMVTPEFQEMMGKKKVKPSNKQDELHQFVKGTVTPARVEKLVHKLVDKGVIGEDYTLEDMGTILKSLGSAIYEDVIAEESDVVFNILKKRIGKYTPTIIRQVVSENELKGDN